MKYSLMQRLATTQVTNRMKSSVEYVEHGFLVFQFLYYHACLRVEGGNSQYLLKTCRALYFIYYIRKCKAVKLPVFLVSVSS
jgi:hypothetical protein